MTIGELTRRTGLSASAIRYYEVERLIPPPRRRSGRRDFDSGAMSQLVVVQLARDSGFSIAEVRSLVTEFGRERWRKLAQRKLGEIRSASRRLRVMTNLLEKLLDCECPDIEFCGRAISRSRSGSSPKTRSGASSRARPPLSLRPKV
ncbi:MAG TPA: MerR family transcriptional regulator [Thermoanaerobaculia bacterium]|jgi:DNA-binding transcriptional MerR regulator